MSRRSWLIPLFAILSIVLSVAPWENFGGIWYVNNSPLSWVLLYFGICFLGMFAWELGTTIRKFSNTVLVAFWALMVIATAMTLHFFPIEVVPGLPFFAVERLPFYLMFLVTIILTWNLVMMSGKTSKSLFWWNAIAAISILFMNYILWFYNYYYYGQMTSFFIAVIPTVVVWECVVELSKSGRNWYAIFASIMITGLAALVAIDTGSLVWVA